MITSNILDFVISFDLASIFIMVLLIISIIIKKLYKSDSSKLFIVLIIISLFACIFDILSAHIFNGSYKLTNTIKNLGVIFNTLYYLFRNLMILFFIIYIFELTDSFRLLFNNRYKLLLFFLPILISITLILINPINNILFAVKIKDGKYYYSTESLSIILYINVLIYFIVGIVDVIKYKYYFSKNQIISLLSIIPLTLISLIFQYVSKEYDIINDSTILVEMFASTLALILITTTIESASELIDTKTGITSFEQFNKEISHAIDSKNKLNIALIKIHDYYNIYNKFDYDRANAFIYNIGQSLNKSFKHITRYKTYFIDDGLFALTFLNDNKIDTLTEAIEIELGSTIEIDNNMKYGVCIIKLPNDFDTVNSLIRYCRVYNNNNNYLPKKIFNYSDYKNDKNFIIINNIDKILDEDIRLNEFEVYYQPIYNTKTKTFTSCEALVRLISTKYGFIGPEYFINYAEISGKIFEIDSYVIKDTIKFISTETFKELNISKININLSISECMDLNLYNYVVDLINQYKIDPKYINFEITEGKDIINHNQIYDVIKKFKELGIEFSLDDYGIGYSNIERFSNFPISTVKIDKMLVNNSKNEGMQSVLSNTFNMIKSLGRKIVVEGIETKESLDEFMKYNCDFIQGFIYSKPVPKDEFVEFIKKTK